jgi:hypothetical protein
MSGVTNRCSRCCFGSRRINAARTARPGQEERGRLTCLRNTRDLVTQDEDLGVLGCLLLRQQSEPAYELAEDQVEQSERHGW